jgi:hypothetical protein
MGNFEEMQDSVTKKRYLVYYDSTGCYVIRELTQAKGKIDIKHGEFGGTTAFL